MPTNEEQFVLLLRQATPDLYEINRLLNETEIDSMTVIKFLSLIKNVQLLSGWGKVTILIQDKQPVRLDQEQGYKIEK